MSERASADFPRSSSCYRSRGFRQPASPDHRRVANDSQVMVHGWDLRCKPEVTYVHSTSTTLADQVLSHRQGVPRERCRGGVSPAEVARQRRLLQLPQKALHPMENHTLGGRLPLASYLMNRWCNQ